MEEEEDGPLPPPLRGMRWTLIVEEAADLERLVSHHELTSITIPSLGLEAQSERTANLDLPLSMLLTLMEQG
jgi:hypothetical protein